MALVKTVYVLVHAAEVANDIGKLEQVVQSHLSENVRGSSSHGMTAAVKAVKAFWEQELNRATTAGAHWQNLVSLANECNADDESRYRSCMDALKGGFAMMLRARS